MLCYMTLHYNHVYAVSLHYLLLTWVSPAQRILLSNHCSRFQSPKSNSHSTLRGKAGWSKSPKFCNFQGFPHFTSSLSSSVLAGWAPPASSNGFLSSFSRLLRRRHISFLLANFPSNLSPFPFIQVFHTDIENKTMSKIKSAIWGSPTQVLGIGWITRRLAELNFETDLKSILAATSPLCGDNFGRAAAGWFPNMLYQRITRTVNMLTC